MGDLQPIRITEYEILPGVFTGTTYTLVLEQVLSRDYFVLVELTSEDTATQGPRTRLARLDADPYGSGDLDTLSSPVQLRFTRANAEVELVGVIKVVECVGDHDVNGFRLRHVAEVTMPATTAGTQTVTDSVDGRWVDATQCIPFGGITGAGVTLDESAEAQHDEAAARIQVSGTGTLTVTRRVIATAATADAVLTIPVIEFGSAYIVRHAEIDEASPNYGSATTPSNWNTASIDSVTAENAFAWGCGYTHDLDGSAQGRGICYALGTGASAASGATTAVAALTRTDPSELHADVYVLSHPDMTVQHDADHGMTFSDNTYAFTLTSEPLAEEGRDEGSAIQRTHGYRLALFSGHMSTQGTHADSVYVRLNDTFEASAQRYRTGNVGWGGALQVIDFGSIALVPITLASAAYEDFAVGRATAQVAYQGSYATRARELLPSQFRDLPGWIAWTKAVGAVFQSIEDLAFYAIVDRHLLAATGAALEKWGDLVGEQRLGLTGDEYRRVIRAKIMAYRSNGEVDSLVRIYQVLMGTAEVHARPLTKHMTLQAVRNTPLSDVMAQRVPRVMAAARSAGESLTLIEAMQQSLGFTGNPDALGLDAGVLARTL